MNSFTSFYHNNNIFCMRSTVANCFHAFLNGNEIIPETTSSWWNPLLESNAKKPRNWPAINPLTKLDKPRTRNRFVSGFMAGQFLGFFAFDSNKGFHHDEVVSGIISVFLFFEKFKIRGCENSSSMANQWHEFEPVWTRSSFFTPKKSRKKCLIRRKKLPESWSAWSICLFTWFSAQFVKVEFQILKEQFSLSTPRKKKILPESWSAWSTCSLTWFSDRFVKVEFLLFGKAVLLSHST